MAGTLRGQLGVKSSPLCPTASKLTTQYLVLDHMNNHYKKLSKAKSSIDNRPPKSISSSQKVRERNQRNTVSRSGSRMSERPDSRNTYRPYSQLENSDIYDETNWGEPIDDEDTNVMSIMKDVLKKNTTGHVQISESPNTSKFENTMVWPPKDAYDTQQRHATQLTNRPISARSMASAGSRSASQLMVKKAAPSGDVLEKRPHIFTEPDKPFTPRTLKSTRSSRLSEYKYYTAPKKHSERSKSQEKGMDDIDGPPRPKPRNRPTSAKGKLDLTQDSENTLMFETLQTRDYSRSAQNKSEMVPPLDISIDKDHMSWLQEQASKAQIRAQSSRSPKSALKGGGTFRKSGEMNRSFGLNRSWARDKVTSEGEPEYVEFVKNVTQDVLTRGIFTNRVLMQAFENHIQKNKGRLDENKMRANLARLREELGIPSDMEADMDDKNLGHSSRRSSGLQGQRSARSNPVRTQPTHQSWKTEKTQDLHSNYPGLNKTGTSAWPSEEGGTLQSRTFGETVDYNSTFQSNHSELQPNQDNLYTATLENDGDLLMVTQALETYQMTISQKDLEESHVSRAHRGLTTGNSEGNGSVRTGDSHMSSEAALSEKSDRSERPTPRQKRRMRRREAQELHNSDNGHASLQQNNSESVGNFHAVEKSQTVERIISVEKSEYAHGSIIAADRLSSHSKDKSDHGSERSFRSQRMEPNRLTGTQMLGRSRQGSIANSEGTESHQRRTDMEDYQNHNGTPNPETTENERRKMDAGLEKYYATANGTDDELSRSEKNSTSGGILNERNGFDKERSLESSMNVIQVASKNEDGHFEDDGNRSNKIGNYDKGLEKNDETHNDVSRADDKDDDEGNCDDYYADDYEDDDADDEEATTLTHRTSDEDF